MIAPTFTSKALLGFEGDSRQHAAPTILQRVLPPRPAIVTRGRSPLESGLVKEHRSLAEVLPISSIQLPGMIEELTPRTYKTARVGDGPVYSRSLLVVTVWVAYLVCSQG